MRFKLLIVEDTPAIIEVLREVLGKAFPKSEIRDTGFKGAPAELEWFRPDVVILDLAEGVAGIDAASKSWDFVWKRHFCPVIIHSAYDSSAYEPQNHPFRKYERKTKDSPSRVAILIRDLFEHIGGVRALRDEIENKIADSLQVVSPLVWQDTLQPADRCEMLRRVTRRRIAASLDSSTRGAESVKAIEQFVCPPLEPSLLTGDVLVQRGSDLDAPASYRLILTPSCDMVPGEGRCALGDILVARCVAVTDAEILRRYTLKANAADLAGQIGRRLREDGRSDGVVFPALSGVWPAMVADLKRLELIERTKVALSEQDKPDLTDFFRVASMDSPFRERVAWRYVETVGRPGLPVLDKAALEKDIVEAATPKPVT
jgi:hypothetical protein